MKRLILMRHAKSSWENLNLADHDRSLNDRGRNDCQLMANWIKTTNCVPTQALCSTALRCVETHEAFCLAAGFDPETEYKKGMYHSSSDQLLAQLKQATQDQVLVVAHNPGISEFASRILVTVPTRTKFVVYPTASITVVNFGETKWQDIEFSTGNLEHFVTPRDFK